MVPAAAPRPARVDTYDAADPLEDVEDERLLGDAMGGEVAKEGVHAVAPLSKQRPLRLSRRVCRRARA